MIFLIPIVSIVTVVAIATFVGLGRCLQRRNVAGNSDSILDAMWLGLAAACAVLQVLHLFVPIRWPIAIALAVLAIVPAGGALRTAAAACWAHPRWAALWLAIVVWSVDRSIGPGVPWDFGLYHLPTIGWMTAAPVVPGLGNLHWRLALNSSLFLLAALFDVRSAGFWPQYAVGGVLVTMLAAESCVGFCRLSVPGSSVKASDVVRALAMIPVVFAIVDWLPSVSPDLAFLAVGIAGAIRLADLLLEELPPSERDAAARMIVVLLILAVTVKLTAAAYAAASIMAGVASLPTRRLLSLLAFAGSVVILLLGVWAFRGVVLSGYPMFPFAAFGGHVEWRVPEAFARTYVESAQWHARGAAPGQTIGQWMKPWFAGVAWRTGKLIMFAPLAVGAITAIIGSSRRRWWSSPGALFLSPALTAIVVWFVEAPVPRFAAPVFWHAAAALILLPWPRTSPAVRSAVVRRFVPWSIAGLVAVVLVQKAGTIPLWVASPPVAASTAVTTFVTAFGLRLNVPTASDRCEEAPAPCTPYPDSRLALRDGHRLAGGFIRSDDAAR